jgi:hypothetical protein
LNKRLYHQRGRKLQKSVFFSEVLPENGQHMVPLWMCCLNVLYMGRPRKERQRVREMENVCLKERGERERECVCVRERVRE